MNDMIFDTTDRAAPQTAAEAGMALLLAELQALARILPPHEAPPPAPQDAASAAEPVSAAGDFFDNMPV